MTDLVPTSSSKAPDTRSAVVAALNALDQGTRAQTAAAAHRNDRVLAGDALQLVERMSGELLIFPESAICHTQETELLLSTGCRGHPCPGRRGTHGGFHYN